MRVFYGMLGVFVFLSCTLSVRASDDYYTNLKKDANSGNALAQYKLGAMYLVVSGDYKKAFIGLISRRFRVIQMPKIT